MKNKQYIYWHANGNKKMLHYPTDRDPVDSIIQSSNKWSLLNSFIYLSFCLSTNVYS